MPTRFEQLYSLPDNLYSDGSPVILSKGVLSKDSQTGSIIIQLKFHNVSTQIIKALKVSIITYDVTGVEIEESCDYQYLDLKVKPGEDFGSKKAIIVSNSVSRSFKIKSITVVMNQDTVQEVPMPLEPLPEPDTLQNALDDPELVKQYQLTVSSKATYVPQEISSLWQCTCGEWNSGTTCTKCHAEKTKAFSSLDTSFLRDEIKQREEKETAEKEKRRVQEQQKAEQEEKQRAEQKERENLQQEQIKKDRHKKVRLAIIIIAVVVIIVAIILVLVNVLRNDEDENSTSSDVVSSEVYTSGSCGENLRWSLKDNTLTITGTGTMDNYATTANEDLDVAPWFNYASSIESVVIDNGVTSIGSSAFYNLRNITDVLISSTVDYIGDLAFANCINLSSITFKGNAPTFDGDSIFANVGTAVNYCTAFYPAGTKSWTNKNKRNYGGFIDWVRQET